MWGHHRERGTRKGGHATARVQTLVGNVGDTELSPVAQGTSRTATGEDEGPGQWLCPCGRGAFSNPGAEGRKPSGLSYWQLWLGPTGSMEEGQGPLPPRSQDSVGHTGCSCCPPPTSCNAVWAGVGELPVERGSHDPSSCREQQVRSHSHSSYGHTELPAAGSGSQMSPTHTLVPTQLQDTAPQSNPGETGSVQRLSGGPGSERSREAAAAALQGKEGRGGDGCP